MINPDALAPLLQEANAEHWQAAAQGRLLVPHCSACGHHWFPHAFICPRCLSDQVQWTQVSGRATLWSWCEFHQPYFAPLRDKVPYVVLLAQLEEGPLLYGNLAEGAAQDLRIGMALQAHCHPAGDAGAVDFRIAGERETRRAQ